MVGLKPIPCQGQTLAGYPRLLLLAHLNSRAFFLWRVSSLPKKLPHEGVVNEQRRHHHLMVSRFLLPELAQGILDE